MRALILMLGAISLANTLHTPTSSLTPKIAKVSCAPLFTERLMRVTAHTATPIFMR